MTTLSPTHLFLSACLLIAGAALFFAGRTGRWKFGRVKWQDKVEITGIDLETAGSILVENLKQAGFSIRSADLNLICGYRPRGSFTDTYNQMKWAQAAIATIQIDAISEDRVLVIATVQMDEFLITDTGEGDHYRALLRQITNLE